MYLLFIYLFNLGIDVALFWSLGSRFFITDLPYTLEKKPLHNGAFQTFPLNYAH